jgi:DHA1 family tetracycline resistance protein-like MFS transporter
MNYWSAKIAPFNRAELLPIEFMSSESTTERFFTPPLVIILITVFIDLIGFGMVIPILPFYAEIFQATPLEIGFLFSIYSWMQFLCAPVLGRLSDMYGRRPILLISLLGSAVGYFVLGLANTLVLVFVGRIISGITGANISTAQAYIADVTTRENRAKGMGLFGATFGLGFVLGPAIAGILSKYGVHVPFYVAAALSLANSIALYFLLPESIKSGSHVVSEKKNRIVELIESLKEREFGVINLVYFLLITAFSIMTYAFVLFTAFRYGYNAEQNGYLFTFVGVISIIGQGFLFGHLVKRIGEANLTVIGCILMVISLFIFPFFGPSFGGLAALLGVCTILSIGNAFASPSLTSLASKISSDDKQGSSMGIMQSGASLARAIGPTIGGLLLNNTINKVDDFTVSRTFWTASAIMFVALLTAIYAVKVMREHAAIQTI